MNIINHSVDNNTISLWEKVLTVGDPDIRQGNVIDSFTVFFNDNYSADIKLVSGEPAFVDAVLFDPNGHEVCCIPPEAESIIGEYIFDDTHTVIISKNS